MVQSLFDDDSPTNSSSTNIHNNEKYNFFKSDNNFYIVLVITVVIFIILGILLLVCLICKPSYWKGQKLVSHPIEFLHDSNHNLTSRSELSVTNTTTIKAETINTTIQYDNQTKMTDRSTRTYNGNMSVLGTNLPPLMSKANNLLKPKEIKKLRNALDKIENDQDEGVFKKLDKHSYNELAPYIRCIEPSWWTFKLEQLDITSLSYMDDGFD